MSSMNDIDAGKLIAVVEQLSKDILLLNTRIAELEGQINKGKGMFIGIFIAASGFGAAASSAFTKWIAH